MVNPMRLQKYGITPSEVYNAVTQNNLNVGGDVIEKNGQAYVVRGIGLLTNIADIEAIIVDEQGGLPVLVRDVAQVIESNQPRVGQVGLDKSDDMVEGIIVQRKGENPSAVLKRVKDKIADLNEKVLPKDVKMVTFYDRDRLMTYCTETVLHNLAEGILFVTVIVFLFMADWRTTLIVSIIIPLSPAVCVFLSPPARYVGESAVDGCSRLRHYHRRCGRHGRGDFCHAGPSGA